MLKVANRKLEWLRKHRYFKAQRILPTRLKKHLELWYLPVKTLATSQEVTAKIWKDSTGEKKYPWIPLEAFNFKSSHLKCKAAQRRLIGNGHILGRCVCFDSLWEIITLLGIRSHFSFLRIFKTVHVTDAGKMGIWPLVLC